MFSVIEFILIKFQNCTDWWRTWRRRQVPRRRQLLLRGYKALMLLLQRSTVQPANWRINCCFSALKRHSQSRNQRIMAAFSVPCLRPPVRMDALCNCYVCGFNGIALRCAAVLPPAKTIGIWGMSVARSVQFYALARTLIDYNFIRSGCIAAAAARRKWARM